jgi:c-di-GMP-binding flagellar brake protein YcgR
MGAKRRDTIPPTGTEVTLSILLGDEVVTAPTLLLDPIISTEGDTMFPPILRVAWLKDPIEFRRRKDVRVATLDLPPLQAFMIHNGTRYAASLLNLTETGAGIALKERVSFLSHDRVEVEVELPGGHPVLALGEIRHSQCLDRDNLPTRLGLVFLSLSEESTEALRSFVQARRTDRSVQIRRSIGPGAQS